jgi:hypothetical protein
MEPFWIVMSYLTTGACGCAIGMTGMFIALVVMGMAGMERKEARNGTAN